MIAKAKLHYLKIAPRKVRLVADLIRGKKVEDAQNILNFTQKKASLHLLKLLNQAFSNAINNNPGVKEDNVLISRIFVDGGPVAKRRFPRARGKSDVIRKRTSHVTIILDGTVKEVKDVTKNKKLKTEKNIEQKEKKAVKTEKKTKKTVVKKAKATLKKKPQK